ncbi:MAG: LacI family transcriptional regulator [Actinomycetia bacterium]|nr:LacI family transcriptional regulator [Actinomycetes bacterium]MCL2734073.1 LacI family transcriptional regulator [Actinomycetes bacterium]
MAGSDERGRVSITDVAKRAGVSTTTVSYVFSGHRHVAQKTREHVLEIVREMGYEPNQLARGLRTRRSHTIALIIPDITNPFYTSLARGLQDVVAADGYQVFVCNTDGDHASEQAALKQMVARSVDAVAFAGYFNHRRDVAPLVANGTPVVLVGAGTPGAGVDVLSTDDVAAGELATQHLLHRGHRRIAFITGPEREGPPADRVAGYRKALAEADARYRKAYVARTSFSRAGGAEAMGRLLDLPQPPKAVICTNDMVAIGAIDTARSRGLRIPDDVAVMGFDDIEAAALISPALTTVSVRPHEQGQGVGRLLLQRLEDPDAVRQRVLYAPAVVARDSA